MRPQSCENYSHPASSSLLNQASFCLGRTMHLVLRRCVYLGSLAHVMAVTEEVVITGRKKCATEFRLMIGDGFGRTNLKSLLLNFLLSDVKLLCVLAQNLC